MKRLIASFLLLTASSSAFGSSTIDLFCDRTASPHSCEDRVILTMDALGCNPLAETLRCAESESEPEMDYCRIDVLNCMEPTADLVFTTQCRQGEKVSLRKHFPGLSLTWWMGFGPYLKNICKF